MAEIDPLRLPELYDAVCQLNASLQLDEVIDSALKAAIKLTGAERAFIKSPDAYFSVYAIPKLEYATQRPIEMSLEALVRDVEQSRQSIAIMDRHNDPRFAAEPLVALFASRAMLIVPLQASREFLGVLIVDRAISAGAFTFEDLATLEFFAGWAAIVIHDAQLHKREGRFISTALTKSLDD